MEKMSIRGKTLALRDGSSSSRPIDDGSALLTDLVCRPPLSVYIAAPTLHVLDVVQGLKGFFAFRGVELCNVRREGEAFSLVVRSQTPEKKKKEEKKKQSARRWRGQ